MATVRSGVAGRANTQTGTHKSGRSGKAVKIVAGNKAYVTPIQNDFTVAVRSGGIGFFVEVHNTGAVMEALAAKSQQLAQAAYVAAQNEADRELKIADTYVPRNTGALAGTGRIEYPEDSEGLMLVAIAYGDEAVDYAVVVHEDLEAKHAPPTKAKWLEETVYEEMELGEGLARIQADIVSMMSGGSGGGTQS